MNKHLQKKSILFLVFLFSFFVFISNGLAADNIVTMTQIYHKKVSQYDSVPSDIVVTFQYNKDSGEYVNKSLMIEGYYGSNTKATKNRITFITSEKNIKQFGNLYLNSVYSQKKFPSQLFCIYDISIKGFLKVNQINEYDHRIVCSFDAKDVKNVKGHNLTGDLVIENDNGKNSETEKDYGTGTSGCALLGGEDSQTRKILNWVIKLIRFGVPILIVVLGISDFLSIVFSGEEKNFKEAGMRFMKRIFAGVIVLFAPILIEFVLKLSGLLGAYGIDDIFCIF